MSRVGDLNNTAQQAAPASAANPKSAGGGFGDMDSGQFLRLLVSELQNQDPLKPMDNSQMVQQISQIRNIASTDELSKTLSNLNESQELVTASSLIGQTVQGLADNSSAVDGTVDRVTVETDSGTKSRKIKIHVGDQTMDIKNVRSIINQ